MPPEEINDELGVFGFGIRVVREGVLKIIPCKGLKVYAFTFG